MTQTHRILIAGATGAIGRPLTPALIAAGHDVHALVRSDSSAETVSELGARPVLGDALDRLDVLNAVDTVRPSVIVHQLTALPRGSAGPKSMRASLEQTSKLRREATHHLAEAAEASGVQQLIAQSIAFAYRPDGPWIVDEDHPLDVEADGTWGEVVRAVAELEHTVTSGSFTGTVLRYGGFYGPGTAVAHDGFVGRLAAKRRLPIIGDGEGIQSYIHLDDAVSATLAAIDGPGGIWNVVDDDPVPAKEWIPALAETLGAGPPRHVPAIIAKAVAGDDAVRTMTVQRGASNARIKRDLGWKPRYASWRDGFKELTPPIRT